METFFEGMFYINLSGILIALVSKCVNNEPSGFKNQAAEYFTSIYCYLAHNVWKDKVPVRVSLELSLYSVSLICSIKICIFQ